MLPNETRAALQVYIDSSLADRSRTSEPPLAEPNWVSFEKVRYYASIPPKRISIKWAVFRPADKTWYFVRNDAPGMWSISGGDYRMRLCQPTERLHKMVTCNISPDRALAALGQKFHESDLRSRLLLVDLVTGEVMDTFDSVRDYPLASWSADSRFLLADSGRNEVVLWDADKKAITTIAKGHGPSWSPRGAFIAWSPVRSRDDLIADNAPIVISKAADLTTAGSKERTALHIWRTVTDENGKAARRNDFCDLTWLDEDHVVWYPERVGAPTPIYIYSIKMDRSWVVSRSHSPTGSLAQLGMKSLNRYLQSQNKAEDATKRETNHRGL